MVVGALAVREIHVRGTEAQAVSLWILVGKDGSIEQGTAVRVWWDSPTC